MSDRVIRDSWLNEYLRYTQDHESPFEFHKMTAISCIGAALKRNVWIDMGMYTVYPNNFIILIGDSGVVRKSSAMLLGVGLLRKLPAELSVREMSQKITVEALLEFLSQPIKVEKLADGNVELKGSSIGLISASELQAFLGADAVKSGILSWLIKGWDCEENMDYTTVSRGTTYIRRACISLIGASTVDNLRLALPAGAVGGGFTSRVLFMEKSKARKHVAFPLMTPEMTSQRDRLIADLHRISMMSGQFVIQPPAKAWYTEWYRHFREWLEVTPTSDVGDIGFQSRKHVHILKLAMCLSACESSSLLIEKFHLIGALEIVDACRASTSLEVRNLDMSPEAMKANRILSQIQKTGEIKRRDLLKNCYYFASASEVTEYTDSLSEQGKIRIMAAKNGGTKYQYVRSSK